MGVRKARDAEMLQMIMDKDACKSEVDKKLEQERLLEREHRLRRAEKQRVKVEAQLLTAHQVMGLDFGKAGRKMLLMEDCNELNMQMQDSFEMSQQPPRQPVAHSHIHQHMHYQEGSDFGSGLDSGTQVVFPGTEEQRQIEMASEARVQAQFEALPCSLPRVHMDPPVTL